MVSRGDRFLFDRDRCEFLSVDEGVMSEGYLGDAITKALDELAAKLLQHAQEILYVPVGDLRSGISYAPFTEYGIPPNSLIDELNSFQYSPEPTNVIDSDAIVIDENVLALPAPGQKEIENDFRHAATTSKTIVDN